jgi:ribosomal protein S18 acetylase RimI-like enzyme
VIRVEAATVDDAPAILTLQKLAYESEARLYNDWTIPPLTQTLESLVQEFSASVVLKAMAGDRLAGSVRARARGDVCEIGRLVVRPELQGRGIGSSLLREIEAAFDRVVRYELFTGSRSEGNIRLYQRHGYAITRTQVISPALSLVFLEKCRQDARRS